MVTKKLKTDVRQRQIKNAAAEIISQQSLSKLTIDSISQIIGITKSNIYRHYPGKDAIINDILTEINTTLKEILLNTKKIDTATDKLKHVFFNHVKLLENFKGAPFLIFLDKNYMENSKAKEIMNETIDYYMKFIKKTIIAGINNCEFKESCEPNNSSIVFLGNIQAVIFQWVLSNYSLSINARTSVFWDFFISAVTKTKSRR